MRIYQSSSGHFYVSQKKESGWFCFDMTPPDIYDVKLCECCFGQEEKNAWELSKEVSSEDYKIFNEMMQRNNNYTDVRDFIMKYYDVSTGFVDEKLDFRPDIVDLTKYIIKKSGYENLFSMFYFKDLYNNVKTSMPSTWTTITSAYGVTGPAPADGSAAGFDAAAAAALLRPDLRRVLGPARPCGLF